MVSAALKYVPQPAATTFAFSSVFILLLWPCSKRQLSLAVCHAGVVALDDPLLPGLPRYAALNGHLIPTPKLQNKRLTIIFS